MMKSKILALLVVFIPVLGYAAVGQNNMTINVGGGLNYSQATWNEPKDVDAKDRTSTALGGGFSIELGHLYLGQGSIIHAMDTRLGFGMNFDPVKTIMGQEVNLPDKTTASFNTLNVYLGTTYAVGTQVGEGRI
ncbi:MAG: hypothetical protein ACRC0X_08165, partial [Brevinema sp.]